MSIEIRVTNLGLAHTNAYLVGDTETNEAILIDPVDRADLLHQMAHDAGWTIKLIIATHAHFDHVLASAELKALTGAPFWIHSEAAPLLANLPNTGVRFTGKPFPDAAEPDHLLGDNELITVGAITLETLFTPGHAPGHIALWMQAENIVFSGDALFAGSIGRTDLPGSDSELLLRSIRERLLTLSDDVIVLPGHGESTSIGKERATNPWLQV